MTESQRSQIKAPKPERKISVDDWLFEKEMEAIKQQRENLNGSNGSNEARKICHCLETRMPDGTRHPLHTEADCAYTAARGVLVFTASQLATATGETGYRWVRIFAANMEELARKEGLI
jgi:hypothetical protein